MGALLGSACCIWGIAATGAQADTSNFASTGVEQTFTVPANVTTVHVVAIGGRGGAAFAPGLGGLGAVAAADLSVTPGQVLFVEVASNGGDRVLSSPTVNTTNGGFNGGGSGGGTGLNQGAGGGGGASDVRTLSRSAPGSLNSRLIVAGGGGGRGAVSAAAGGAAGADGSDGSVAGSHGRKGSSNSGGAGGTGDPTPAADGHSGVAGIGGDGGVGNGGDAAGGGGGGGLYGGGGGGSAANRPTGTGAGGGGGSSGFGAGVTGGSIGADATGVSSVTLTYVAGPAAAVPSQVQLLAVGPRSFASANVGGSIISIAKKKAPVGTTVSYVLSTAATTSFSIERLTKGRKVGKKCKKKTSKNKKRKSCTLVKTVKGTFSHTGGTGLNKFKFSGRINNKALKRGKYRLVARVQASVKRAEFKIVR